MKVYNLYYIYYIYMSAHKQLQEGGADRIREDLQGPFKTVLEAARAVCTVQKECNIEIDVDEVIQKISPDVMELCAAWCGGKKFVDVRTSYT
jgi:superfamily II RNA helicase